MKKILLKIVTILFLCLGLTTLMSAQTVIQVAAGENAIGDALLDAFAGDTIELTTSGGIYTDSATHQIMFDITIRAAEGLAEKPVIDGGSNSPIIDIIEGGITIKGVKFINGDGVIYSHAAETVTSSDFSLKIDNCEFWDWTQRAIHTADNIWTPLDSILVSNTIFMNGDEQAFYLKSTKAENKIFPGGYKYCKIYNCLIAGLTSSGDGHAMYIEPGDRAVGDQPGPELIIDHVTVDNCESGIYNHGVSGALIQNCIVTNNWAADKKCFEVRSGEFTTPALPTVSTIKNSIYSGGTLDLRPSDPTPSIAENVDSVAAQFTNAATGDYSLKAGTDGIAAGTDGKDLGFLGPYPTMPVEATLPMIASGGFEEDTAFLAWTTDWESSSINTDAAFVAHGTKSLKIGAQGGRGQYVYGATPGTTISLLAWGKSDLVLDQHAYIGFRALDEFDIKLEEVDSDVDGATLINPDEWLRLCATMTVPEGTTVILVYFWSSAEAAGGQSVYTDDYEFKFGDSCAVSNVKVDPIEYNSSVNVYPNPTMGTVTISLGKDVVGASGLEIFDVTGKLISRVNDLNGRDMIDVDLSSAPAGMYFGMLKAEGKVHTFKILKKQ